MNILTRFKEIMASNIHALLDKAEDPGKMIEQCLRNLTSDLGKVKSETAAVMAEEQRAKRELNDCTAEMNKMQSFAVKALELGNEDDARAFLERKKAFASKENELKRAYEWAASNASKMKDMHDKLVKDIGELESRKNIIKGKLAVAKTQERINKMTSSVGSANHSISAFERMEEKATQALDKANAMAELNAPPKDEMSDLMEKYNVNERQSDVDSELEALKESLKRNN